MVMQAADLGNLNHFSEAHLLDRSELWRILLKRQVRAILMVIVKIAPEDSQARILETKPTKAVPQS